jgi:competence protein ComEA
MLRLRHLCQFLFASITALSASVCLGATDAELDSIKGLGPSSTARILKARALSPFKDWDDFLRRVKGFKPSSAARLSDAGLTVNGRPFEATASPKVAP